MGPGNRDELVVVGGGISGLAVALAVARAGLAVRVLEQAQEFGEIGAGIELGPNATRILADWGLLKEITDVAVLPRRVVLRSAITGEEFSWLDVGERFRRRYGAPYVVCHRNDLLMALLRACRSEPGIVLQTGRSVVEVEPDAARVRCSDGSVVEGMGLVGADGLRSVARRAVWDDEPVCAGYVSYRGAIPLNAATRPSALDEVVGWIGPGLHFVQYALHEQDLYNQVAVFRSSRYAQGAEDWGTPEELDRAFTVACQPVREALQAIKRDARWYMYDRDPISNWTRGRLTLVGDAAHPMLQYLAQGACQALEDAAALGEAVRQHTAGGSNPDGLPGAFLSYQDARLAQACRVQRNARLWGNIWHTSDPLALTLRGAVFQLRAPDDYRFTDWLYDPAHAASSSAAGLRAQAQA